MAQTMMEVLREIIQDNNENRSKRIFDDPDVQRALHNYMRTYKQRKLSNLDGLGKRFESAVPHWLDGVESHKSADESQVFYLDAVVYRGATMAVVPPAEYVVDVVNGVLIFTTEQTEAIYATFYATNPHHAGADLLEELAAKKSRSALGVQLGSLSVNMGKLPDALRKQADELRAMGGPLMGENLRSDRPARVRRQGNFGR